MKEIVTVVVNGLKISEPIHWNVGRENGYLVTDETSVYILAAIGKKRNRWIDVNDERAETLIVLIRHILGVVGESRVNAEHLTDRRADGKKQVWVKVHHPTAKMVARTPVLVDCERATSPLASENNLSL